MKISTKGRYALIMMVDLALNQGDEGRFVALKDIAARQDVSKKYLEQIIPILNRLDMLITNRGFQGGYRLARKPEEYRIGDILRLTEGGIAPVSCLEGKENNCPRKENCSTLSMWEGLNKVIGEYLDGITLQDLVDNEKDSFIYQI